MRSRELFGTAVGVAFLVSCGGGPPALPGSGSSAFDAEETTVIGNETGDVVEGDERITTSGPTDDGDCVDISSTLCVPTDTTGEFCEREGGPVDVIIVDGEVVDVVCYPPADSSERPVELVDGSTQGDIDIAQQANDTTIVFADELDGTPIEGDLSIDGNNVAVFGNGVDATIIDGDVSLEGNNTRIRGVTITGNLTVSLNNVAIVLVRVLGNLELIGSSTNNSIIVENDIFGNVTINSNGNTITGNDVQGTWSVSGADLTCDANRAFEDTNTNELVDDDERGTDLECEGLAGPPI